MSRTKYKRLNQKYVFSETFFVPNALYENVGGIVAVQCSRWDNLDLLKLCKKLAFKDMFRLTNRYDVFYDMRKHIPEFFVFLEGICLVSSDNPNLEVHFIKILVQDKGTMYMVIYGNGCVSVLKQGKEKQLV
jgi:hypothetical protein